VTVSTEPVRKSRTEALLPLLHFQARETAQLATGLMTWIKKLSVKKINSLPGEIMKNT